MPHWTGTEDTAQAIAWGSQTLYDRVRLLNCRDGGSWSVNSLQNRIKKEYEGARSFEEFRSVVLDSLELELVNENSDNQWPSQVPYPEWLGDLNALIEYAGSHSLKGDYTLTDHPFGHVLKIWVDYTLEHIHANNDLSRFSETAITSLEKWLLERLSEIAAKPLYVEFQVYGAETVGPEFTKSNLKEATDRNNISTDIYDSFVKEFLSQSRLREFFAEYPVLARFCAVTIHQWVDVVVELHERVDADWAELVEPIQSGESPDTLEDLQILTDDRHRDGRGVVEVTVNDHHTWVYKPRSSSWAQLLYELLEHIESYLHVDFSFPQIVDGEYSWVSKLSPLPCDTTCDVRTYYQKVGILAAISHLLYINDIHHENLFARGNDPIVVDAETMLQPKEEFTRSQRTLHESLDGSLLWTGLLPVQTNGANNGDHVAAGLEWPTIREVTASVTDEWSLINTDRMHPTESRLQDELVANPTNLPKQNGEIQRPRAFVKAILEGMNAVESLLTDDRVDVIPPEIDTRLKQMGTRYVYRNTARYGQILNNITAVEALRDGGEVTLRLDYSLFGGPGQNSRDSRRICEHERHSLLRLDVPYFQVTPEGVLKSDHGTIGGQLIQQPGYDRFNDRKKKLRRTGLTRQKEYLHCLLRPMESPVCKTDSTVRKPMDQMNSDE